DCPAHRQELNQHLPAFPRHLLAADDEVERDEYVCAAGRSILERRAERQVAAPYSYAGGGGRNERGGNAVFFLFADQMVRVVKLEGEAEDCGDRRERYVPLVPVQPDADNFFPLPVALA